MKVLIIRLSAMGDVVLTTPLARMLSQQLKAEVHFLTKATYSPLLSSHPYIDQVHIYNQSNLDRLKDISFDWIIDLQKNLKSLKLTLTLKGQKISWDKRTWSKWKNLLLRTPPDEPSVVSRYMETILALGIQDDGLGLTLPDFKEAYPLDPLSEKPKVVIALGGTRLTKRIPIDLVRALIADQQYEYHLIGGADVAPLKDLPPHAHDHIHDHINQLTIPQSCSVIQQSDAVISGDTGMMHIASAYQKPLVVIWGSTSPKWGFAPYYGTQSEVRAEFVMQDHLDCHPCSKYGKDTCPKGHMLCLEQVESQDIHRALTKVIK